MTEVPERALIYGSGLAFLVWAGASIAWSPVAYDKLWASAQLAGISLSFAAGLRLPNSRPVVIALLGLVSANSLVALWQWSQGDSLGFEGYPGWMGNPNIFGCFLVVALAAALSHRQWWFLPFCALGFLEIRSRGSILALGVTLAIWFWPQRKVCSFASLVLAFVAIIEIGSGGSGMGGGGGGGAGEAGSAWEGREIGIMARLGIWQDTLNHLTLWGSGFGSFFEAYNLWPIHTNMTLMRASHTYNDFLELIFELGLGAITLWTLMILSLSRESPARLPCFAFFALALTYSPLTLPVLSQIFAFFLGQAAQATLKGTTYGSLETYHSALPQGARY